MTEAKPTAKQILAALEQAGTVAAAAQLLGLSERTLYRRMGVFGIRVRRVPVQEPAA